MLFRSMLLSTWTNEAVTLPIDDDLYLSQLQKRIANSKVKQNTAEQVFDTSGTYGK